VIGFSHRLEPLGSASETRFELLVEEGTEIWVLFTKASIDRIRRRIAISVYGMTGALSLVRAGGKDLSTQYQHTDLGEIMGTHSQLSQWLGY